MKHLLRITALSTFLMLTACAATTSKLTASDAQQLKGKGVMFTVIPSGSPSSNLDGAMFPGPLGAVVQAAKGHSMQERLQLPDPSIKVESYLRKAVTEKYHTTSNREYTMTINTSYWWIGKPLGSGDDNVFAAAIIEMKLVSPSGTTIASDVFNGVADPKKFPVGLDDIRAGNNEKIRLAFDHLAESAANKFIASLSN
jgi:hypothetical protein